MNKGLSSISEPTSWFKLLRPFLLWLLTLQLAFFLFTIVSAWLPATNIHRNIESSVEAVIQQGDYPEPLIKGRKHSLDYSMDAMMVNMIYTIDPSSPLNSALLLNSRHSNGPYVSQWNQVKYNIENKTLEPNLQYPRYWHGSTFFFRWFFLFSTFNDLKWILYVITSLLLLVSAINLYRELASAQTLALFTSFFFVNGYIMQFSMQFAPILLITFASVVAITRIEASNEQKAGLIFLFAAAFTAFFDLLTTPLMSFGIPLLIWINRQTDLESKNFKQLIAKPVWFGLIWLTAFTITWASKWILTWMLTDFPIFSNVFNEAAHLSADQEGSRIHAIVDNVNQLPLVIINSMLFILGMFAVFFHKPHQGKKNLLLFLTALLPFVWLMLMANHSIIHSWFTYRMLAISLTGLFFIFINMISEEKLIAFFRFSANSVRR